MEAMKSEAGSGGGASSKELEQLKAENEQLKKINAKQQYRIEHLVHNLKELLQWISWNEMEYPQSIKWMQLKGSHGYKYVKGKVYLDIEGDPKTSCEFYY